MVKYYTGKDLCTYPQIQTFDILSKLLSNDELSQIQEPSLLFTGKSDSGCLAYAIGKDNSIFNQLFTSKREQYIKETISLILNEPGIKYRRILPPVTESDKDEHEDTGIGIRFRITDRTSDIVDEKEELDEDEEFYSDACQQAQRYVAQLLQKGYSKDTIWALLAPMRELSPILITKDLRILLTSYRLEIKLPPVQKAVYLLFLKHPQGIKFKDMPDYQQELLLIYRKLAVRGMVEKHLATIADLVNPLSNSMNEKCSTIKSRVTALLDDSLAKHYYISGGRGEVKKIDISPDLIIWE